MVGCAGDQHPIRLNQLKRTPRPKEGILDMFDDFQADDRGENSPSSRQVIVAFPE